MPGGFALGEQGGGVEVGPLNLVHQVDGNINRIGKGVENHLGRFVRIHPCGE